MKKRVFFKFAPKKESAVLGLKDGLGEENSLSLWSRPFEPICRGREERTNAALCVNEGAGNRVNAGGTAEIFALRAWIIPGARGVFYAFCIMLK